MKLKKRKEYRKTAAVNYRNMLFKYYNIDKNHDFAVPAGRCRCSRITDIYCSNCNSYICENHLFTNEEDYFCEDCRPDNSRELNKKEIRKIRQAKLF